jgi:biopolymer transport protein ExbD
MRRRPPIRRTGEPTIALINVVFLMLIFFLVAGTIAPPPDAGLRLVSVVELEPAAAPDGLVIRADGTTLHRGAPVSPEAVGAAGGTVRLVPDRELPASDLVRIARALKAAGAEAVVVVGEQAAR